MGDALDRLRYDMIPCIIKVIIKVGFSMDARQASNKCILVCRCSVGRDLMTHNTCAADSLREEYHVGTCKY